MGLSTEHKVGLGGGCHWCTEGVFQSLIGVIKVEQGWISSTGVYSDFSEGVIVNFDTEIIGLKDLIEIHLLTHASTSDHSMRGKYRSAIYNFNECQLIESQSILNSLKEDFESTIITKVMPFDDFRLNQKEYQNYFYSKPDSPFCTSYIHPKLEILNRKFKRKLNPAKIKQLAEKNITL